MTSPITDRIESAHRQEMTDAIEGMIGFIHVVNVANGWFDGTKREFGMELALIHSEVSEMLEAYRKDNWSGEKDSVQDEAADILIRLLDFCYRNDINLTKQFFAKMRINEGRGYRHGGKLA